MGTSGQRVLSFTEIQTALTCQAQWDFAYGGRLAGSTLKPKGVAPILSEGRAWGAAVAAWHHHGGELLALWEAHRALKASLDADVAEMAKRGWPLPPLEQRNETEDRLSAMLDHYAATATPLPNLTRLEGEVMVAIPSRSGRRASTRYRLQCFLDGFTAEDNQQWIVEFKLRGRLTDPVLLKRQRQPLWYAWGLRTQQGGYPPSGVIVDERLNEVPKPAKINKGRVSKAHPNGQPAPSHAVDQLTTPELYAEACHQYGEMPKLEVMDALRQRQWQQRYPLSYRPSQLDDAGAELVSAARLIRDLDNGTLTPIRNAQRAVCNGCKFKAICADPQDALFVESDFERTVPKRLREPKPTTEVEATP